MEPAETVKKVAKVFTLPTFYIALLLPFFLKTLHLLSLIVLKVLVLLLKSRLLLFLLVALASCQPNCKTIDCKETLVSPLYLRIIFYAGIFRKYYLRISC